MGAQPEREAVDALIESYVDWLEECDALAGAYDNWAQVAVSDRDLAFTAYRAALDREHRASAAYREQVDRIRQEVEPVAVAAGRAFPTPGVGSAAPQSRAPGYGRSDFTE